MVKIFSKFIERFLKVLLAELDRIARIDAKSDDKNNYLPIILTGDFNVQQNSEVFRLIAGENIYPEKLLNKMNFNISDAVKLLPLELGISDACQHINRHQTAVHFSFYFFSC